jgi:hypothetical protein
MAQWPVHLVFTSVSIGPFCEVNTCTDSHKSGLTKHERPPKTTAVFSSNCGFLLHVPGGGGSSISVSIQRFCEVIICANTLKSSLFNA